MSASVLDPSPVITLSAATTRRARHFVPDHLGWFAVSDPVAGWCRLAPRTDSLAPHVLTSPGLAAATGHVTTVDRLPLPADAINSLPGRLATRLRRRSPLTRVPTPTVWEAVATAIVRQVVHRDQARRVHARIAEQLGTPMLVAGRARHAFPSAQALLAAGERRLRDTGVGFKARTLLTTAEWTLEGREVLDAAALHDALLALRGVGPWTAGVAVCDRFSDYRYYPIDDLAVQAAARASWPERRWPSQPRAFAREWTAATAPFTGALTAYVLADGLLSDP